MNPNFALDFRNDQIVLLHSQEGVWVQIGVVAIDDPDLDAALSYMRSTALGLSPRGIASKLILPDAAILYTTLDTLSLDAQTRATQIALALIGRTPYEVADLVYDWTDDGTRAHMAVIARETLDEAESFANQHRFNPVAFAAWPEQGLFQGEADFGRSANAQEFTGPLIAPALPDNAAVLSASDFEMGEPEVDAAQDIIAQEQTDSVAGNNILTVPTPPVTPAETGLENDPSPHDMAINSPEIAASMAADDAFLDVFPALREPLDAAQQETGDFDLRDAVSFYPDASEPTDAVRSDPDASQSTDAFRSYPDASEPTEYVPSDFDAAEPSEAMLSDADQPTETVLPDPVAPQATSVAVQPDLFSSPTSFDAVMADEAPMALDVPIDDTIVEDPVRVAGPSAGKAQTLLAEFAARREAALGKADTLGRFEPAMSAGKTAAPSILADSRTESAPKIAATATQNLSRIKESSLGSKPAIKRPAPKARGSRSALMGFVLTILLLIALAAAAAFSSFISSAWNVDSATTAVASVQPSVADEVAADLPDDDVMAPSSPAPQTADLAVPNALSEPVSFPVPSLAAESAGSLVPLATPAALPQPIVVAPPDITTASAEIAPAAPLITPTAQGVMTPEGVFLIAGRPSVLPLARPATVVAAALQRPAIAENIPTGIAADPALAGKRPLARPDGLVSSVAAVAILNDPSLAGKRPLVRPEAVLAAANAAQIALSSLAQIDANAPRSAMAVTISRFPVPRPQGLKPAPEAPQELALATPELVTPDTTTPEAVAPDAPLEADNEPEVIASKSSGPRTVVSKNATYTNAINLSKVNLIGVYGSQSSRYALIRQSNGRFKKVYVGDRFDGGLVAAITESELRYSKGGQMLALQMPKG